MTGWFAEEQHGFLSNRSTTSNLLNVSTCIAENLANKSQVDIAYFDFQKAFDRVDNDVLLYKMGVAGFSRSLLKYFANYLMGREQYVIYKSARSDLYPVTSGIGQGSSLGPLLFLIFINDLPTHIKHSTVLMYADDVKIAIPINASNDTDKLQEDINNIYTWSTKNRLSLNVNKCAVMSYSKATLPIHNTYTLNSVVLNRVSTIRDLGTHFDPHLTFNQNIIQTCNRSRKNLGYVMRQAKIFNNPQAITILYNSYVRSVLETNCAIWNPHEKSYTLLVEKVQKSFTRCLYLKMYGYYPYMYPTPFVLGMVSYQSLEVRRKLMTVTYFFRLIRGSICNPSLLQYISISVPLPARRTLRPRQRPLFVVPNTTVALATSPLYLALTHINDILLSDGIIDIFSYTEPRFLATASLYLESVTTSSTIA